MIEYNEKEFSTNLTKWIETFNLENDAAIRGIATRMFENIVRLTPVGDADYWQGHPKGNPSGNAKPPVGYVGGYARANWWPSLNNPINSPSGNGSPGNPGQTQDLASVFMNGKAWDVFHIQNGVPYIQFLENGTASPRQAPQGMVAVTFANTNAFFKQLFRQFAKGGA